MYTSGATREPLCGNSEPKSVPSWNQEGFAFYAFYYVKRKKPWKTIFSRSVYWVFSTHNVDLRNNPDKLFYLNGYKCC